MIPFFIAMPAAWLGYCLQRRSSYMQQLRSLWSRLVEAIQQAIQYTHIENPTAEQYLNVLRIISVSIDEVRGVFSNLNESEDKIGLYPFEPLKDIYGLVQDFGRAQATSEQEREQLREQIFALWRDARRELLKEFDREAPSHPHSHWSQPEKSQVYDRHNITKKVT